MTSQALRTFQRERLNFFDFKSEVCSEAPNQNEDFRTRGAAGSPWVHSCLLFHCLFCLSLISSLDCNCGVAPYQRWCSPLRLGFCGRARILVLGVFHHQFGAGIPAVASRVQNSKTTFTGLKWVLFVNITEDVVRCPLHPLWKGLYEKRSSTTWYFNLSFFGLSIPCWSPPPMTRHFHRFWQRFSRYLFSCSWMI